MAELQDQRDAEIRARWNAGETRQQIEEAMGLTSGQFLGKRVKLNLSSRHVRETALRKDHPAVVEGRTLFPKSVVEPDTVLRPGANQKKIGGKIRKGQWKGMPVFCLTLEERKTCPSACLHWRDCYGNGMHWAKRVRAGREMELRLWDELSDLQLDHPSGFVVRLHVLGDFYSVEYVRFWSEALAQFKGLRIFGYTAHQCGTEIGDAVAALRESCWRRFSVRTSAGPVGLGPRAIVVANVGEAAKEKAIVCPAQVNKADKPVTCSTCALCWSTPRRTIAFLHH